MSRDVLRLTTGTEGAALDLHRVARRLGSSWVLRNVSIRVLPRELIAVVGVNGCGKTTLLRVIAALLLPTRGTARVFGHDVRSDADAARASIGFLGHGSGVYEDLTGVENLVFAQRMFAHRPDPQVVARVLATAGLTAVAHTRARFYSSGMQRRLALARLFMQRPRLLLLDEPYNNLDDEGVTLVDELLAKTMALDGAALVVAHDPGRSGVRFDRVLEMRDGALHDTPPNSARAAVGGR